MRLREQVTLTPVDGECAVLLDERSGRYYQLNATAYLLLRELLAGAAPDHAAARLTDRHPEAAGRAEADTAALIADLRRADLVRDDG